MAVFSMTFRLSDSRLISHAPRECGAPPTNCFGDIVSAPQDPYKIDRGCGTMTQTQPTVQTLKAVSRRLVWALVALLVALIALYAGLFFINQVPVMPVVMIFGALGAFVSLQRRLKRLSEQDLLADEGLTTLHVARAGDWSTACGATVRAVSSNLLSGEAFPKFEYLESPRRLDSRSFPYGERRPSHVCKAFVLVVRRRILGEIRYRYHRPIPVTSGINGPPSNQGRGI